MKRFKKLFYILPLTIFILVVILLQKGLALHPSVIPSPLINQATPFLRLPTLFDNQKMLTNENFKGHITLLNVWASWCSVCAEEHAFLVEIAKSHDFVLIGVDYKDDPSDAKKWLQQNRNPYALIGMDQDGHTAIDWGVYGTPELFIIDKKGMIRYKWIGLLTPSVWKKEIEPVLQQLKDEK